MITVYLVLTLYTGKINVYKTGMDIKTCVLYSETFKDATCVEVK